MYSLFTHAHARYLFSVIIFFSFAFFNTNSHAAVVEKDTAREKDLVIEKDKANANALEQSYQAAISQAYQELSENSAFTLNTPDINTLIEKVTAAHKNKNPEQVLGLLLNNINIIKNNYKSKQISELVGITLKNYSLGTAQKIRAAIDVQAPRTITASCDYEIANYLANQNSWDDALALLKSIDLGNDLSSANSDNAFIIWGAALQHTKKHRQALEYYQHIKAESPLYPLAQLDIALVYIRQDWWTDAQIAMQNSIKANGEKNIEFTNRVYTTLGFSQLQQGFYRNARESFRNVKIKSEYADQALLGLGMAALNQEDFVGAFNAFDQLKKHQQQTAPIEQSYLMSAFTLAKLKQNKSSAAAYADAEAYYERKRNIVSNITNQFSSADNNDWQSLATKLIQEGVTPSPESQAFENQLTVLSRLMSYPVSDKVKSTLSSAYFQILKSYQSDTKNTLDKRVLVLNSYLNQSRFGLTKLYDTP